MLPCLPNRQAACIAAASLALTVGALGMGGCGQVSPSSSTLSVVRIIDASVDAGGLDVYANTAPLVYSLGFGTVSSYITFQPAIYTFNADQAGSRNVLASLRGTVAAGQQYTLVLGNVGANLQGTLLVDQGVAAPTGHIALRFLDQSTRAGSLDLYLIPQGATLLTTQPVLTNIAFNNIPAYINVPTGTYQLAIVPNGTVPTTTTVPVYTGASVSYPAGSARTLMILDEEIVTKPGVQVITANDFDSGTAH